MSHPQQPYGHPQDPYGAPPPYGPPVPSGQAGAPPPQLPPYPHAQAEPYHRILRTWTYHWWRVVVGVVAVVAAGMVVGPVVVFALVGAGVELLGLGSAGQLVEGLDAGSGSLTPAALLAVNLALAALIPITWVAVRYLHNLRPRWLGSVRPRLRWGLLGRCFGVALVATLVAVLATSFLPGDVTPTDGGTTVQSTSTTVAYLLIIALTSPLQAAGEEYFFRGYLLQGFGALVRAPWFALVCTSLLFAAAHGAQNLPLFVDRFAFGLVAGALVLYTGGIEVGIAMHIVNNVVVLGLAAATGTVSQALGTTEASWSMVVFDVGQFVVYAALVVWMCRWRPVQTRTSGPPAAPGS
jgi:uncharacterized protein